MFAVDDLDDTLARLRKHGAQLVDEVVGGTRDVYRLWLTSWGPERTAHIAACAKGSEGFEPFNPLG